MALAQALESEYDEELMMTSSAMEQSRLAEAFIMGLGLYLNNNAAAPTGGGLPHEGYPSKQPSPEPIAEPTETTQSVEQQFSVQSTPPTVDAIDETSVIMEQRGVQSALKALQDRRASSATPTYVPMTRPRRLSHEKVAASLSGAPAAPPEHAPEQEQCPSTDDKLNHAQEEKEKEKEHEQQQHEDSASVRELCELTALMEKDERRAEPELLAVPLTLSRRASREQSHTPPAVLLETAACAPRFERTPSIDDIRRQQEMEELEERDAYMEGLVQHQQRHAVLYAPRDEAGATPFFECFVSGLHALLGCDGALR